MYHSHHLKVAPYPFALNPTRRLKSGEKTSTQGFNKLRCRGFSVGQKFFWFFALSTSVVLSIWQATVCLKEFFSHPISTKVEIEPLNQYDMPTIVICSYSWSFFYDFKPRFDKQCQAQPKCRNKTSAKEKSRMNFDEMNTTLMNMWLDNNLANISYELRCQTAVDVSLCEGLMNKKWEITENCLGRCYEYDSDLMWYFITNTFGPVQINITNDNYTMSKFAAQIFVHSSSVVDKYNLETGNVLLRTNSSNIAYFTMTEFQRINSSEKPCRTEAEVAMCMNNCMDKNLADERITCKWPFLKDSKYQDCNSMDEINQFRKKLWNSFFLRYKCRCLFPCTSIQYKVEIVDLEDLELGTVLQISPDQNSKLKVVEYYSYSLSNLVAELSGSLGFFLGISLISIFEAFHLTLEYDYSRFKLIAKLLCQSSPQD